ncbi:orotate phosphoribosyltransferase-like protein [compost metagenome]
MDIINPSDTELDILCEELSRNIVADFKPDLVIGIATGGKIVAEKVNEHIKCPIIILKRQRTGTIKKNKLNLQKFLSILPEHFNNKLRKAEALFNEFWYEVNDQALKENEVILISGSISKIKSAFKIIVIDDAVDSGSTLKDTLNFLKELANKNTIIKTACINITYVNPGVKPDFFIYKRCMVRYPWAIDFRKKNEKSRI